jgi:tRNA(Arg) A34 adenosine deaminase TadA
MQEAPAHPHRRDLLAAGAAAAWSLLSSAMALAQTPPLPADSRRWYEAALAMKRLAESWGDQPYGAVLVLGGALAGEGPSRVVQLGDPDAHAERVAIRDAQRRVGRDDLAGAILFSTARPCGACERAAARAGVARMIHGAMLTDAGAPSA